jgi:DNA-binding response OmpR family regulator
MPGQLLLVDDEPGLREAVQAYLEDSGFTVAAASNAGDGLLLARQSLPDLVITDIMMPQVDGYQFLKQLREDPKFKTLPVVFLTARGMTSDRIQGYNAGADAYLSKPFDPDELVAIVTNLLQKRDAVRAAGEDEPRNIDDVIREIEEIKRLLTREARSLNCQTPSRLISPLESKAS